MLPDIMALLPREGNPAGDKEVPRPRDEPEEPGRRLEARVKRKEPPHTPENRSRACRRR